MHIVIAPDSFKESLPAYEVAQALKIGFQEALPEATFDLIPLGDGGEGTLDALIDGLNLSKHKLIVTGALGEDVEVDYASDSQLAVFEMAAICGLGKVPKEARNPLTLRTEGVGQMISHLIKQGVKEIMIGVGGSATNDGGIGMAAGLGYHFFDEVGRIVEPIGENLGKIRKMTSPSLDLSRVKLTIITDVKNPLCGQSGATYTFAAQKGLTEDQFGQVDQAMASFYQLVNSEVLSLEGAGAGGGMAAGLVTFANGQIVSGIDAVLDVLDFDRHVQNADLVIVGEGRMDKQSLAGKAPIGVARRTPDGIPIIAICGSLKEDLPAFPIENIIAAFPIIAGVDSLENTLAHARPNLIRTAQNIGNLLREIEKSKS